MANSQSARGFCVMAVASCRHQASGNCHWRGYSSFKARCNRFRRSCILFLHQINCQYRRTDSLEPSTIQLPYSCPIAPKRSCCRLSPHSTWFKYSWISAPRRINRSAPCHQDLSSSAMNTLYSTRHPTRTREHGYFTPKIMIRHLFDTTQANILQVRTTRRKIQRRTHTQDGRLGRRRIPDHSTMCEQNQ